MNYLAGIFLSALFLMPFVQQKDTIKTKPVPESLKKLVEQVVKSPENADELEIEIDGLLVDDTKTKIGKDFYDLFYSSWVAPLEAKNYIITISEKPFRLTSTLIVVSINDTPVYQSILQPRQDIIEGLSINAIETTQSYLANYEEIMRQLNGDDMVGTGIF
ncbi:MAG: CsgE family curli-type amyloid fiber assembly protein [Prolixibacteraceae bacterium]|jgi:curli production assembly/transport component CsgE